MMRGATMRSRQPPRRPPVSGDLQPKSSATRELTAQRGRRGAQQIHKTGRANRRAAAMGAKPIIARHRPQGLQRAESHSRAAARSRPCDVPNCQPAAGQHRPSVRGAPPIARGSAGVNPSHPRSRRSPHNISKIVQLSRKSSTGSSTKTTPRTPRAAAARFTPLAARDRPKSEIRTTSAWGGTAPVSKQVQPVRRRLHQR